MMPVVTVKYLTVFSNLTGRREEEVKLPEGLKLKDLAERLSRRYGGEFSRHMSHAMLLVNGRQADLDYMLSHGDIVVLSYPVGGG